MKTEFYTYTHPGKLRRENQDRISVIPVSDDTMFFSVFDGMGGEQCGNIAAEIAVNRLTAEISKGERNLSTICLMINADICRYMKENNISSMGTTAAIIRIENEKITVCNIGDSRVYKISNSEIEQISIDHIMDAGRFRTRRVLTQHLGISPEEIVIEPYENTLCVAEGDIYLLCSDGLTDMVTDEIICNIILKNKIEQAGEKLLEKALSNGGKDNVSFIICKVIN